MWIPPSNEEDKLLTLSDIKPYLTNAKERAGQIICSCPLCESNDPKGHHLYIRNDNSALLLYCQKCNTNGEEIIKAFRNMGAKHITNEITTPKTLIEDYNHEYRNPDGTLAYCKRRRKWSDGSKRFSFFYVDDNGETIYTKPDNCNVLYNLDLMTEACSQETIPRLYIVEGEKCADALTKAGLLATTSNTGSQKRIKFSDIDKAILSAFPDKVVITDNDEKGLEFAEAWENVVVLKITDIWKDAPNKADIFDYLEQGLPIEALQKFKVYKFDIESIAKVDAEQILSDEFFNSLCSIKNELERQRALAIAGQRASELKLKRAFDSMFKIYLTQFAKTKINHGNIIGLEDKDNPPIKGLYCGEWIVDITGIYKPIQTEDGEYQLERISSMPIIPTAILRNIETGTEKISLAYFRDETWTTINIARSIISNNAKIIDLSDLGVDVNSGTAKDLVKYLAVIINSNDSKKLPRLNTVGHLGWVEENFIPYCKNVKTDVSVDFVETVQAIEIPKGNLDEWINVVGRLRKNISMRMIINASLSSPIVSKVNALPFMLHLWGGTGSGKTVGLMVAASIWGNPAIGKCVKSLNNTQNYILNQLSMLKHLPFFGDELQTIRSVDGYDKLIMKICEGVDRGRLDTRGIAQRLNSWCNVSITTGEEPCVQSNSGGGTVNRVIEIECVEKVVENGPEISNFVKSNYGHFGRLWIEKIKEYDLMSQYREMYNYLLEDNRITEKQAMAMALLMVTDNIANELFNDDSIPYLSVEDILPFTKTKEDVDVTERAWEYIQSMITVHDTNFIKGDSSFAMSNTVWGKYNAQRTNVLFFINNILDDLLTEKGFNLKACKEKWLAKGRIELYGGKFTCPQRIAGNKVRCVSLIIDK